MSSIIPVTENVCLGGNHGQDFPKNFFNEKGNNQSHKTDLLVVRTVSSLFGKFLSCTDNEETVRKVFGLSRKFPALFRIDMNF